jgi:hypothetical protein
MEVRQQDVNAAQREGQLLPQISDPCPSIENDQGTFVPLNGYTGCVTAIAGGIDAG